MKPPVPENEAERMVALERSHILDTLPEQAFDRVVEIASKLCETPIALVCLIDRDRQWFKSRVGLDIEETSRDVSICAHAVAADKELLVEDARLDERFADNELVNGPPEIRFYYGVPVHDESRHVLGTLCVIDRRPRTLTKTQMIIMRHLAREVETELKLRSRQHELQQMLDERVVIGTMVARDADNLMSQTLGELEVLRMRLDGGDQAAVTRALGSVERLIRLCQSFVSLNGGGGLSLEPVTAPTDLKEWFRLLVRRERRLRGGLAQLDAADLLVKPVHETDPSVLDRMVMHLLNHAFRHSPPGSAVRLELTDGPRGGFSIVVGDRGPALPGELSDRVFDPFASFQKGERGSGAGLGLAFCRLAAEALGGYIVLEAREGKGAQFRVDIVGLESP